MNKIVQYYEPNTASVNENILTVTSNSVPTKHVLKKKKKVSYLL